MKTTNKERSTQLRVAEPYTWYFTVFGIHKKKDSLKHLFSWLASLGYGQFPSLNQNQKFKEYYIV